MVWIISFVMMIFILILVVVFLIGVGVIYLVGWCGVFGLFVVLVLIGSLWLNLCCEEILLFECCCLMNLCSMVFGVCEVLGDG